MFGLRERLYSWHMAVCQNKRQVYFSGLMMRIHRLSTATTIFSGTAQFAPFARKATSASVCVFCIEHKWAFRHHSKAHKWKRDIKQKMPSRFKMSEFALKQGNNRTQTEWEIKNSKVCQEQGFTSIAVLKYLKRLTSCIIHTGDL